MKISLVVAQGVHQGKVIPVTVAEFLIGRDPECQLRPASPQVSKKHCAVFIRDRKVFVRDYGSTNGTFINGEQVAGEKEIASGDHLKAGPLEFNIRIEATATQPALKTNTKQQVANTSVSVASNSVSTALETKPTSSVEKASDSEDAEHLAALLLGGDETTSGTEGTAEQGVPDGTTVMELPAIQGGDKKDQKKPDPNTADTSSAAAAILQKYMRRPRT